MKREVKISAYGAELTVTIEGNAPIELIRELADKVVEVGWSIKSDYISITDTVHGETVEP